MDRDLQTTLASVTRQLRWPMTLRKSHLAVMPVSAGPGTKIAEVGGLFELFRRDQMIERAPLIGPLGVHLAGVGELQCPPEPDHLGQVIGAAVLDDLPGIVIADETGPLAANPNVAVQC